MEETTHKPSLFDILEEIQNIRDEFGDVEIGATHDENEAMSDEQTKAVADYLAELDLAKADKVDAICGCIRMLKHQADACRAEAQHMASKARSKENLANSMKAYFLGVMEQHGEKRLSGETYSMSRRATKVAVIEDEKLIPDQWIVVKTERSPVKNEILKALKEGHDVPGCRLGESISLIVR